MLLDSTRASNRYFSMNHTPQHDYHYICPKSGNDGSSSDSEDEENKALFKSEVDNRGIIRLPEELKETLNKKRAEPEKNEKEEITLVKVKELVSDDDSEELIDEPKDCDQVLGYYYNVEKIRRNAVTRYKVELRNVIFKIGHQDYVAATFKADITY